MNRGTDIDDGDLLALPDSATAREAVDWVLRIESRSLANHSIRAFLFARLLARHRGLRPGPDYDPELLFLACVLHDLGLSEEGNGNQRFEVDGADLAARFLTAHGFNDEAVDTVWQAIALHTSPGIAERRGAVCALMIGGTVIDVTAAGSEFISDADAQRIHEAYPRLSVVHELMSSIGGQVAARPEKGPRVSFPGEVGRMWAAGHLGSFEDEVRATSRWGS